MVGGMTGVLSDVIPFGLSLGNRNNLVGLNLIGLRRAKVSNDDINNTVSRDNFDITDEQDKVNERYSKMIFTHTDEASIDLFHLLKTKF